jgi:hypothetical protein
VEELNFSPTKKHCHFRFSVEEKSLLDFEVNEHVGIDDSFGLRELVNQKRIPPVPCVGVGQRADKGLHW